eukprot:345813_1
MALRYAIFIQSVYLTIATWIVSDDMTWLSTGHAVGVHDDTIYILGGWSAQKQVVQYQWNVWLTNTVLDIQTDALTINQAGSAQYWAQTNDNLYLIDMETYKLAVFDLATNTLNPSVSTFALSIGNTGRASACLASYSQYVYVLGGSEGTNALQTVQALNTITLEWITTIDNMQHTRKGCASIVHSNYLYAFGGWAVESIERISIIDITQNQWEWSGGLAVTVYQGRCTSWRDYIYIVGGCSCEVSGSASDTVHILDTTAVTMYDTLPVLTDPMPYGGINVAPIVVDGVLYVFGGLKDTNDNAVHKVAYYMLRTGTPTKTPSDYPTTAPTQPPTRYPSQSPSNAPTQPPSTTPTQPPSNAPSTAPSSSPTQPPSVVPSFAPTS